VVHNPSGRTAVVMSARAFESESLVTVRLAEGNLMTASAAEFRPATEDEIARHHQETAQAFPLPMAPGADGQFRNMHREIPPRM